MKRRNGPRSLECIPQETQTENSKLLTVGSFQKETTRAGSSAWYERRIRNAEVVGSNPARSTETSSKKFHQELFLCFGVVDSLE